MQTGRLLRRSGLDTELLPDSQIASGGVDLFTAGNRRIAVPGAQVGVHSWCCEGDLTAGELPRDHPAHQHQLRYFMEMMGDEIGRDFYFCTLSAAPFNGIHWMSDDEICKWTVATEFQPAAN